MIVVPAEECGQPGSASNILEEDEVFVGDEQEEREEEKEEDKDERDEDEEDEDEDK